MTGGTLLKLSGALTRRRVIFPFFLLILALLSSAWLTLPDQTGRAANSTPQSDAVKTQVTVKSSPTATDFRVSTVQLGEILAGSVIRTDESIPVLRIPDSVSPATLTTEAPELERKQEPVRQDEKVAPSPPPKFTFMGPASGCLVKVPRPAFHWRLSGVPGNVQKVIFTLKVVELQPEQNLEEALLKNAPVLERGNLIGTFFQPPESNSPFKPGKVYAWSVTASDVGGTELSKSPAAFFGYQSWPPCFLSVYQSGIFDYCLPAEDLTVAFAYPGNLSWSLSPGGASGVVQSLHITIPKGLLPTTPGTYHYILTATNGNCTLSREITINVFAPAVGGVAGVSPLQICDGDTAVLDVQGESGTVVRWEYSDNGGVTWFDATSDFSIAGAPARTNQMYRSNPHQPSSCIAPWFTDRKFRALISTSSATNALTCATKYSEPTTLRIYCKPRAGTVTASKPRFCKYPPPAPPASITLTMAGPIVGDFDWYANGVLIPGSHNQNPFSVTAPTTTTIYSVKVDTGAIPLCGSQTSSVTVTVDDQPTCPAGGGITQDVEEVCPGGAAVLSCNCAGTVTWQQSATGLKNSWTTVSIGNSVQNTTDLNATSYWQAIITGTPGSTCPSITTNTVRISVRPRPAAPVVEPPEPVCFGGTATLISKTPPQAGVTYQWYHDDVPIAGCTNLQSCIVNRAEPGNYWVEADNGCEMVQSKFVTIPVEIITITLEDIPCCGKGVDIWLSATAESSLSGLITNPKLYRWYQGTVEVGTGPKIKVNPTSTAEYCVKVSSPTVSDCSATACATITVCP